MTAQALLRNRYVDASVATASPARLLTMLYDRLVRDLSEAEQALAAGDPATGTDRLRHAQEIVMELQSGLDPTKWSGGPALAQLYAFLLRELIGANIAGDGARVARCRALVEPLRDAWHQAAAQIAAG